MTSRARGFLLAGLLALTLPAAATETLNGFDLDGLSVDRSLVQRGGPPRDGIPALTDPAFLSAAEARLPDDERIIGVAVDGVAKAYPLSIMNWHEVVNDRFDARPVVVTYCPLCFTGMAFEAERDRRRQTFGVSGLLYNSDVLLYDHATESLWSQLAQRAVSGPLNGQTLTLLPTHNTTWAEWRRRHPESLVLSTDTGYRRDYGRDPYLDYATRADVLFPVAFRAQGFHPKELVLGLRLAGATRAYPVSELVRSPLPVEDALAGQRLRIEYDDAHQSGRILDHAGEELPAVMAYWFAWYAFHPDTEVYRAPR